jgi:hypothetical protein
MHTSQSSFARCGACVSQRPLTLALALALGSVPVAGLAATINVFTIDDAGGASNCTLRQAIVSMNTSSVTGTGCVNSGGAFGTGDTINFAPPDFPPFQAKTITLTDVTDNQLAISDANLDIVAGAYAQVTIQRPSGAANNFRIMYDTAPAGGSLTLTHITISNGNASGTPYCSGKHGGGGICITQADLTLNNSTVSGNYAVGYAGGILSRSGNVTLTSSTVSYNASTMFAGGIYVFNNNLILTNSTLSGNVAFVTPLSYGGGIFSQSANITLTNSTLGGNAAGYAGGIFTWSGNVTLTNSTVSGNSGTTAGGSLGNAGGVYDSSGTVTLTNSTLSANSAANHNGGIFSGGGAPNPVQAINSIVAGNVSPGGDMNAALTAGSTNNIVGGDPKLGVLATNGGPTQTMLPKSDSPAIDAADDANCPATDQRGVNRPLGAHCDIGAVELMTAQIANPNLLFTNWSSGIDFSGPLYTAGGDCGGSCFAIGDNFRNHEAWHVTDITVYMVTISGVAGGWRYALFTAAGAQVVAPTDVAPTFTDLGPHSAGYPFSSEYYQGVISGLNLNLLPGQYQLRITNTAQQSVYPAFGVGISSQTVSPGFVQLTGSPTVEALLSTDATQRSQEWAFDLSGTVLPIFKDGFEGP